jgi:hypothetical protein
MYLNFIVPYRARHEQLFRKDQLLKLISNIYQVMNINSIIKYNIYIIEQDNDDLFNRGILLNIGFKESYSKDQTNNNIYIHCNTDYSIPMGILPDIFNNVPDGFIDIHGFPRATLGGFVLFDANSYIKCNGFPNNIYGWGGEDWGIWKRITLSNINIIRPKNLYNQWIIENTLHPRDESRNRINSTMSCNTNDMLISGLNSCMYIINNISLLNNNIFWYKVNFNYK